MHRILLTLLASLLLSEAVRAEAEMVYPPYEDPKVVIEFYFDDPNKIDSALYWIRSFMNPLMDQPYDMAPEFMDIVVVIHGTEIVTLAKHNYEKYKSAVERMRYYAQLGVRFRACSLAADDFGYGANDLQDFIELAPSAMTELVYWQQQGYALLKPEIMEKRFTVEEIR